MKKFKKTEIKVLGKNCFRIQVKGFGYALPDLSLKEFQSLKDAFRGWLNKEGYQGQ